MFVVKGPEATGTNFSFRFAATQVSSEVESAEDRKLKDRGVLCVTSKGCKVPKGAEKVAQEYCGLGYLTEVDELPKKPEQKKTQEPEGGSESK